MTDADLSRSRFEAVTLSAFTIEALNAGGDVRASVEAQLLRLSARAVTSGYEQYAMLFAGPAEPLLPQGTYRFRHAQLGELMLFMVPVAQDAVSTQYEVCVSRELV